MMPFCSFKFLPGTHSILNGFQTFMISMVLRLLCVCTKDTIQGIPTSDVLNGNWSHLLKNRTSVFGHAKQMKLRYSGRMCLGSCQSQWWTPGERLATGGEVAKLCEAPCFSQRWRRNAERRWMWWNGRPAQKPELMSYLEYLEQCLPGKAKESICFDMFWWQKLWPDSPETRWPNIQIVGSCGILQDMKKKREQVRWKIGRSFFSTPCWFKMSAN